MEIAVLILAGCAAWFGYQIYLGYLRKDMRDKFQAAIAVPASDDKTQASDPGLRWSGDESTPLPIKSMSWPQYECLSEAGLGMKVVAVTPDDRYTDRADGSSGHSIKTIRALEKHGLLVAEQPGIYRITDLGLRAAETLTVRR